MKTSIKTLIVLLSFISLVFIDCSPKTVSAIEEKEAVVVVDHNVESPPPLPPLQSSSPDLTFDPAVKIGKLSNGMKYYIRKNAKPGELKAEIAAAVARAKAKQNS